MCSRTAMPQNRYSFTKAQRVHGRLEFAAVFDANVKYARGPVVAFAKATDLPRARLGLSVSRRVGTAPRRNRIKRLLREAFRLMQHDFPRSYDLVLVIRPHEPLMLAEYQKLLSAMLVKLHAAWQKRNEQERT